MSELAIDAKGLSRNFGDVKAIQSLDLQVDTGSIYGFLGPNGCGKTTTIRLMTGLLKPSDGKVSVLGYSLPKESEALRFNIGYMTQKFSLYDDLTVKENLNFLADIYGIDVRTKTRRVEELIDTYGLVNKTNQLSSTMSGGQRQRLSLAGALIHKPKLLFLDEPTSAVDPENRRDFWEQLFDLCEQGTTILVSTHYMDEAERCHKLAILEHGIKRTDGSPQNLMDNLNAHVVEIAATELRSLKQTLLASKDVTSAAQLGNRLRVLVDKTIVDPIAFVKKQQKEFRIEEAEITRPSLEDVFVSCTGGATL